MKSPVLYVGDIHGKIDAVARLDDLAIRLEVGTVVQVGDFGAFWPGGQCPIYHFFMKRARDKRSGPRWIITPGNHDNWDRFDLVAAEQQNEPLVEMAPGLMYARRGARYNIGGRTHVMFGGATSTDKHRRTEGMDWWAREEPTHREFTAFFDAMIESKPDVVVTHEAPARVPLERHGRDTNYIVRNLDAALDGCGHEPGLWFFGHHHLKESWQIGGTEFVCCGLNGEAVLLDAAGDMTRVNCMSKYDFYAD
jgi:hypothetical protein